MRKSLSLILSILLVLTLCLGGCNPSEPEEPSASLEESSIPEESSVLEESSLPEESSVPEESSLPEESSVPEESSQPEESSASEESSLPEESSMPEDPSLSVERPASPSAGDTEEMLAAFRDVVASLEEEHGKTTGKADGLCFVKLIDLDRDGVDELFCAWAVIPSIQYQNVIYQWQDGQPVLLLERTGFNQGTGIQPKIVFYVGDDTTYLKYGSEMQDEYLALIDHEITTVATTSYTFGAESQLFNGTAYSDEEFREKLDTFLNDTECITYEFDPSSPAYVMVETF